MSTVILHQDTPVEVQCGNKLFTLYESEDGSLFIEAAGHRYLEITISDDDESQVAARGSWINIDLVPSEESS